MTQKNDDDEIRSMPTDNLLAKINEYDPYDVEFVRRFRELEAERDHYAYQYNEACNTYSDMVTQIEDLESAVINAKAEGHQQGYSQGKAAGDALGAGLREYVKKLEAERDRLRKLDAEYGRVEAAIIMADPNFDGDSPHDDCGDRLIASVQRLAALQTDTDTGGRDSNAFQNI